MDPEPPHGACKGGKQQAARIWTAHAHKQRIHSFHEQMLEALDMKTNRDQMISQGGYPSVEDFARVTEASIPTINRDLRDLRLKFGAEDILQYNRIRKGFYYTQPSFRIPAMLTSEKQ